MSITPTTQMNLFDEPGPIAASPPGLRRVRKPRASVAGRSAADTDSLRVCVLGSGSGGNSTLVRFGAAAMLIDAGFGPLSTARRLEKVGMSLESVKAICVTHLDQDHFRPHWMATLQGWAIRVFLHQFHLEDWNRLPGGPEMVDAGLVQIFDGQCFEPATGMKVTPLRLRHDTQGTSGFRVDTPAGSIGYATDLGHVPKELLERFAGVDLLALESNYDPPMQLRSSRPAFLKRRIMGGAGHLSNEQSFAAVREILDRGGHAPTRHVVLLHRSRQCNCPNLVRQVFAQDPRLPERLTLAEQSRPTRWFRIQTRRCAAQLELFRT